MIKSRPASSIRHVAYSRGVRAVVDSNVLEDSSLIEFLKASPMNRAVVPDFVGMEAYRGDARVNLKSKFGPLSPYAGQFLLLKNTDKVNRLHGKTSGGLVRVTAPYSALAI